MQAKPIISGIFLFLILIFPVSGSLNPPTVYEPGRILWGQYWDFMGQNGARNGSESLSVYPPNFNTCTGFNSTGVNISQWNGINLICTFFPAKGFNGTNGVNGTNGINGSQGPPGIPGVNVSQQLNDIEAANLAQNQSIARLQANTTLDLVAIFPLNVTGGVTKTLTIQPNFTNVRVDTIRPNSSNNSLGVDLLSSIMNIFYGAASYINISSSKINVTSPEINLNGSSKINVTSPEINIFGVLNINGKSVENELVKNSIRAFQTDYLNSSEIYTDLIIIPYDVTFTEFNMGIDSNGTEPFMLNYSIEIFTTYPTSKTKVLNYSLYNHTNIVSDIDYDFNKDQYILINYTRYQNVSKASNSLRFVVR